MMSRFNNRYTKRVLDDVSAERCRTTVRGLNEEIPYACEDPNTDWSYRLGVLGEEHGEVCRELIEPTNVSNMYDELIQVAAVAVSCAESIKACMSPPPTRYMATSRRCPQTMDDIRSAATQELKDQTSISGSEAVWEGDPNVNFTNLKTEAEIDEHEAILQRALAIYQNRNAQYKDIWKEYGYMGSIVHLRTCVERVWRRIHPSAVGQHKSRGKIVDELLDSINYSVFTIRNIEADNAEGTWKW